MKPVDLTTRHYHAKYAQLIKINGTPFLVIKSGKKVDTITVPEIIEDVYGHPLEKIVFKDDKDRS